MSEGLRIAVLIKQVPLVEGTGEPMKLGSDGRLVRHGIELEINPYCRRAITKGVELAEQSGGECVVVTLGPPAAEDSLREAIAAGATRAVLLTDGEFAGSDTLATARALAAGIDREGHFDLVLCGLNSVDADTGQVGPQVAELLDLPFVSGVRALELNDGVLSLECERDDGLIRASVVLPAVLSVAERLTYPAKRSPEERAAVASDAVRRVSASALGEGPWGQSGSPTVVGEIRLTENPRLGHRLSGSFDAQLDELIAALTARGALTPSSTQLTAAVPPSAGGDVAVVVALEPGRVRASRELLGGAALIATDLGGSVLAVRPVGVLSDHHGDLGVYGADEVIGLTTEDGAEPGAEDVAAYLGQVVSERSPSVMLAPSSSWGREVASRFAAATSSGLTGDASSLEVRGGRLIAWKPAFGGQLEAAIAASSAVQCATVRSGALALLSPRYAVAPVATVRVRSRNRVSYSDHRIDEAGDAVATASVLISVGFGVDPDRYGELEPLIESLDAELVATRKVTDKGWLPRTRQVGITGVHVAPRLCITLGAAGKPNHIVGLKAAGTIVAVNTDEKSPVFDAADYGIVGDWSEVASALAERLRSINAR